MLLKGKHSGRTYDVRVKNIPWADRSRCAIYIPRWFGWEVHDTHACKRPNSWVNYATQDQLQEWAQRDLDFFEECRLECNQLETPATLKLSKENT